MLSGGTALEQSATRWASAALGALAKRVPNIAHRRTGSQIDDIPVEEVQPDIRSVRTDRALNR